MADDVAVEWEARGARLLPGGVIVASLGQNTADFRRRARAWLEQVRRAEKQGPVKKPAGL